MMEKESGQDPKRPFKGNIRRNKNHREIRMFLRGKGKKTAGRGLLKRFSGAEKEVSRAGQKRKEGR